MIDIDSGFEEDLQSKNQNCIILEIVNLKKPPKLCDVCEGTDISPLFCKPLVQRIFISTKKKEIVLHLAFQNIELYIVLKTTDLHIEDCTEEPFKVPPPAHRVSCFLRQEFLIFYPKDSQ